MSRIMGTNTAHNNVPRYSIFYYFNRLEVAGFVPALVYFVYSLLMCGIYSLCVGSIGFFATFYFLRKIYAAIKVRTPTKVG